MKRDLLIILGLIAITLAAFWGVGACGFVDLDDDVYVLANRHVLGGLSWENFRWAWTTTYAYNYLPVSWLSLMLDASLFGAGPRGFHWVNIAFHAANACLVYLWFRSATGAVWRSALVAAIFAIHPLRVESVAWVVERKDVLTFFFAVAAMLAYLGFARTLKWRWYGLVLALFAVALLSKQTFATLPFLLLLLDYWPLGRWTGGPLPFDPRAASVPRRSLPALIAEKLPLLAMVVAVGVVTVKAQGSTAISFERIPMSDRLANMPVSYVRYLGKLVWFGHLAVFYPLQHWTSFEIAGSCLILLAITGFSIWKLRAAPWLAVGWFWFLGVMVPMIGLMQFFIQSMADRFTYVPAIGLSVMVAWSIPRETARRKPILAAVSATLLIGVLCFFTREQVGYWRNSLTLFRRDIQVVGDNSLADYNLGTALLAERDFANAVAPLQTAVRLTPNFSQAHLKLALAYMQIQRSGEAFDHLVAAARLNPNNAATHGMLAQLLNRAGRYDLAEQEARVATDLDPHLAMAFNDRGIALVRLGKINEGVDQFRRALDADPGLIAARKNLEAFGQRPE